MSHPFVLFLGDATAPTITIDASSVMKALDESKRMKQIAYELADTILEYDCMIDGEDSYEEKRKFIRVFWPEFEPRK